MSYGLISDRLSVFAFGLFAVMLSPPPLPPPKKKKKKKKKTDMMTTGHEAK